MMTFDGTGNQRGPRKKLQCQGCGEMKAETTFKTDWKDGQLMRDPLCTKCRNRKEARLARAT